MKIATTTTTTMTTAMRMKMIATQTMMRATGRRYSKEFFAERGKAIYENDIRPRLTAKDRGKFLAIDIETGDYAISANELTACNKLRDRIPDAQTFMVRVGYATAHSFGGRKVRQELP